MRRFLATQYPADVSSATHSATANGAVYWLAYCVAESQRRSEDAAQSQTPSYADAVDTICNEFIRGAFRRVLSPEDYDRWSGELEECIARFRRTMMDYIAKYQADALCPAFREQEPMCNTARERIARWLTDDNQIPKYEEPLQMMVSKEYLFRKRLGTFFDHHAVDYCLFELFMGPIAPQLKRNDYWGYMEWRAESQEATRGSTLVWPLRVSLFPNEALNAAMNRPRSDADE